MRSLLWFNSTKITLYKPFVSCQDVADPESDKRQEDKIRMYSEVRNVHMELRLLGDGGKRVEMKMWDVRVEDTDTAVMESGVQR